MSIAFILAMLVVVVGLLAYARVPVLAMLLALALSAPAFSQCGGGGCGGGGFGGFFRGGGGGCSSGSCGMSSGWSGGGCSSGSCGMSSGYSSGGCSDGSCGSSFSSGRIISERVIAINGVPVEQLAKAGCGSSTCKCGPDCKCHDCKCEYPGQCQGKPRSGMQLASTINDDADVTDEEQRMVDAINVYRQGHRLPALAIDATLMRLARRGPPGAHPTTGWGDERPGHTVGHNMQMRGFTKMNGQWIDRKFDRVGVAIENRNYIAVFGKKGS
jgi:hypothetical protein